MIYKEKDPNPWNFVPALIYRQLERLWPRRSGSVAEMSYAFGMLPICRGLDEAVGPATSHGVFVSMEPITIHNPRRAWQALRAIYEAPLEHIYAEAAVDPFNVMGLMRGLKK
jgi:hypothetical protein